MVRKGRLSGNNPFASESKGTLSFDEADKSLYGGEWDKVDAGRMPVRPVSIFDTYPDPTQPRRSMPSVVREKWDEQTNSLPELFTTWISLVEQESGRDFDLEAYLTDSVLQEESLSEDEPNIGLFEAGLLPIVQLAGSIIRDGLVNPITVVQNGKRYLLETGERRWLAFHLLYAYTQDSQWSKISARVMPEFNRFRQAVENTQRANLNLIARARQYALILMKLHEKDVDFQPYGSPESDRAFYAQALDLRIPHGMNEAVLAAFGVTSRGMLTRFRKALTLPDELWTKADDENWHERKLFSALNNLENPPSNPLKRRSVFESKIEDLMNTIQKAKRQDRVRLIDQAITELERLKQNLE